MIFRGVIKVSVVISFIISSIDAGPIDSSRNDNGGWQLNIIHTNDMHSRFEQTTQLSAPHCSASLEEMNQCYGGFPRIATLVKRAKSSSTPTIFLNAGDSYSGSKWFDDYKWKVVAHFLKLLSLDAMSLGNHEFDEKPEGLIPFVKSVPFPVLACNLDLTGEPELAQSGLKGKTVFDVDGHKVGVIGYVTTETKSKKTRKVEFLDEIESIKRQVDELKQEGVNIIIAVGHSGYARDLEIAEAVDGLDLLIGGHTNTFLYHGTEPDVEKKNGSYPTVVEQRTNDGKIKKVYVVQAGAYTKYLGNVSIIFDNDGEITHIEGNPILVDSSVPQDPEVLKELDNYGYPYFNNTEAGVTNVFLDGRDFVCRKSECNLGNLITDAMVEHHKLQYTGSDGWTDAAIAVLEAGTIRSSIETPIGHKIVQGEIDLVLSFESHVTKVDVTGAELIKALENSVYRIVNNDIGDLKGHFLQVSGIKVEFDLSKEPGHKVVEDKLFVRCARCDDAHYEKIDENKIYGVLVDSWLAAGGDEYTMFKKDSKLVHAALLNSTVFEYVKRNSPVNHQIESRITFVPPPSDDDFSFTFISEILEDVFNYFSLD
ncbi:snake venom 5'-nucleotidase-like [Microplitis mediator]|uniref:snake venom 5'-nucleotidase-like n=1 Tax=Microplitis mediator TaxID=375433 RepID=UPI00255735BB|nr:snake venom 5'-nucleotidase-like [Microplitis mediator]XP_057321774.1 snake venom 5'-nucleotidase-like [Microplitis mediator]